MKTLFLSKMRVVPNVGIVFEFGIFFLLVIFYISDLGLTIPIHQTHALMQKQ